MKLRTLLEELRVHRAKGEYQAFVVQLSKGSVEDPVADFTEFPILEIDVEKDAQEMTFISSEGSNELPLLPALTVNDLLYRLSELEKDCADFDIFSGSSMVELGDDHYGRIDTPIFSTGWNDDDKHFGLVQQPKKSAASRWWQFWK
jgi:hypothetical protein